MVPIVYSRRYNITAFGLERLHPFDSTKYRRIHDWLIRQGLRRTGDFVAPTFASDAELATVHDSAYLQTLGDRQVLASILEVPLLRRLPAWLIRWRVLRPMRCATGGTIQACRLALEHGLAINLAGGYHHAGPSRGGGFCVFADVPIALALLRREGKIGSVLVVDTDAHQGNGTADALRPWPSAHMLDLFEEGLFPWPKVAEDLPVPLSASISGSEYLEILHEQLPAAIERYHPDLIVHNAGSDVLETDPLSHLRLSVDDLVERDLLVATEARERSIPVVMVLSGGYGPHSWLAHARSIEAILTRFDR